MGHREFHAAIPKFRSATLFSSCPQSLLHPHTSGCWRGFWDKMAGNLRFRHVETCHSLGSLKGEPPTCCVIRLRCQNFRRFRDPLDAETNQLKNVHPRCSSFSNIHVTRDRIFEFPLNGERSCVKSRACRLWLTTQRYDRMMKLDWVSKRDISQGPANFSEVPKWVLVAL